MEKELFLSGYCRMADQSRMVAVVIEDGALTESDCAWPNCLYAPACPIGKKIEEALN